MREPLSEPMSEMSASLTFEKLRAHVASDLAPARLFAPTRWMVLVVALLAPLSTFLLWRTFGWGSVYGLTGKPWVWGLTAIELSVALVLLVWALREAVPGIRTNLAAMSAGAAGAVVLHAAVVLVTFNRDPVFLAPGTESGIGLYCFTFEVALGLPCVLFALWLSRRGLTSRPRRVGMLGGLGAGLAADSVWRLICPYSDPAHVFGSHSLGVVGVVVLGLLVAAGWEWARTRAWRARNAAF